MSVYLKIRPPYDGIAWIDLSFVKRDRTPRKPIEVGIRCHWTACHNASLQPISTVSVDLLAVDEKMMHFHVQKFWLDGAVDPYTNEILHVSLYPTANKQTMRRFLTELHRRYQLNYVEFLVDDADYIGPVLAEDDYRFKIIQHGNRNAIECIFWE